VVACPGLDSLGVLQIGIRAHGFNIEPGWATNVEFGVKIPQGFDVQSVRAVLREFLGGIGKLMRYSGSIKLAEKGDHNNCGFGTTRIKFGPLYLFGKGQTPHNHWIWSFSSLRVVRCFNREIV
jgi:hypothetical protein